MAYSTFVAANDTAAERTPMVYAGANDGMVHGFNANTGAEVFAFIPTPMWKTFGSPARARITKLAQQNYAHEYFVDGPPSMGDAYWGGAWHTVLAGGLNKGGQGIYALDVTNTVAPRSCRDALRTRRPRSCGSSRTPTMRTWASRSASHRS